AVLAVIRDITARKSSERRQAAQYAVTRALAEAATLDEAAPRILQAICEGLDWDFAALWFVDRHAAALRCADTWHRPGLNLAEFVSLTRQLTLGPGQDIPGRAWAEEKPAWVGAIVPDPDWPRTVAAVRHDLHAAFAVPIRSGNET